MILQQIYNLADGVGVEQKSDSSRIFYAGAKKELKRVMAGIEIGPAEMLMAKILNNIDAVIAYRVTTPDRTADTAKLLDLPLISIKKPAENLAQEFIESAKEKQKIIPEYFEASRGQIKDKAFICLGMNLLLDKIEKNSISVVPCSGLIRVKR